MRLEILSQKSLVPTEKPAIVFVHGAWHGAWCWTETLMPYFAQHGYDTFAISLRGHGKSQLKGSLKFIRIKHYVDDVMGFVAQINRPMVLVGHSMGGFVVQHCMAKQNPNIIKGILIAPVPPTGTPKKSRDIGIPKPSFGDMLKMIFTLQTFPLIGTIDKARAYFFTKNFPEDKMEEVFEQLQDESFLAVLDISGRDLPDVSKVKVPVMVLGGTEDAFFSPSDLQATAKAYQTDLQIFEGMPNNLFIEEGWEKVAESMKNWLEK
jgi:pimeloyl-ACP methyl ester carboxylesterase